MAEPITADYPGIAVTYSEKPYRHYTVNGTKVPSVTAIIGATTDKSGPLQAYAANETLKGATVIFAREAEGYKFFACAVCGAPAHHPAQAKVRHWIKGCDGSIVRVRDLAALPWERLRGQLRTHKLTYSSSTKKAQDRGTHVHDAYEAWGLRGDVPSPASYPEDERGYFQGLARFLVEHAPKVEIAERVVGSVAHGYAGRLDTVAILRDGDGRRGLIDLKTSKRVYPESQFPQLMAYDLALAECGYEATDWQAILRVGADGTYELVPNDGSYNGAEPATHETFVAYLNAYKAQKAVAP